MQFKKVSFSLVRGPLMDIPDSSPLVFVEMIDSFAKAGNFLFDFFL